MTTAFWNRRLFLGASACSVAACGASSSSVTFNVRQRTVVTVDGSDRVFECVRKVRWRDLKDAAMNLGNRFRPTFWAEAAIIDLGPPAGIVFSTLGRLGPRPSGYPNWTLPTSEDFDRRLQDDQWALIQGVPAMREEISVPEDSWPTLVRFHDLHDPASVEEVGPNDLAPDAGLAARISKITVQVTDEPPTNRILTLLPWVQSLSTTLSGSGNRPPRGPVGDLLGPLNFRMWGLP